MFGGYMNCELGIAIGPRLKTFGLHLTLQKEADDIFVRQVAIVH